jgi:integrase
VCSLYQGSFTTSLKSIWIFVLQTWNYFFLNYQNGKCYKQVVGINKIGEQPKIIAQYLKLPNPELFTGHCFRRTGATILADAGGDTLTVKNFGGWKSTQVMETYVEESLDKK